MMKAIREQAMEHDDNPTLLARTASVLVPSTCFAVGIGMLFGGLAGASSAFDRETLTSGLALGSMAVPALGAVVVVLTFRKWPTLRSGDPDTPRTRRISMGMIALMAIACVTAILFSIGDGEARTSELFSNGPLPTSVAVAACALWLLGIPALAYFSRRNADEVDMEYQKFGETIGFQFFGVVAPVWWVAWRGGFAPEPDVMILFVAVLIVSVVGNYIRRAM